MDWQAVDKAISSANGEPFTAHAAAAVGGGCVNVATAWPLLHLGEPVIFDPAVYYGDREADLAMTELFGGFDERFYQSYRQSWPLDPGYETRTVLYNLYHILNHDHLFGGGYAAQGMVDRLLAELS